MIDDTQTLVEHDPKRRPTTEVTIHDSRNPWPLVLYFAHLGESPPFLGFKVMAEEALDPGSFAALARNLRHYVEYAQGVIEWGYGDKTRALEALREAGRGRGLPDRFYRDIAREYEALVRTNDPHPIKSIADKRPVHKSRASRWVKEARARGYVKSGGELK